MNNNETQAAMLQHNRPPLRIFVSCSRFLEDRRRVRDMYDRLGDAGFVPFLDESQVLSNHVWQKQIHATVLTCDIVVICLSRKFVSKGDYLHKLIEEILSAAKKKPTGKIAIIPALLDPVDPPDVLSAWPSVSLFQDNGFQQLLLALNRRRDVFDIKGSSLASAMTVQCAKNKGGLLDDRILDALVEKVFLMEPAEVDFYFRAFAPGEDAGERVQTLIQQAAKQRVEFAGLLDLRFGPNKACDHRHLSAPRKPNVVVRDNTSTYLIPPCSGVISDVVVCLDCGKSIPHNVKTQPRGGQLIWTWAKSQAAAQARAAAQAKVKEQEKLLGCQESEGVKMYADTVSRRKSQPKVRILARSKEQERAHRAQEHGRTKIYPPTALDVEKTKVKKSVLRPKPQ